MIKGEPVIVGGRGPPHFHLIAGMCVIVCAPLMAWTTGYMPCFDPLLPRIPWHGLYLEDESEPIPVKPQGESRLHCTLFHSLL